MVTPSEIARLQAYLRRKFDNALITLKERSKTDDSVEVQLGDEFIGVIYKDTEEGETSYAFNMAILDIDLDGQG